MNNLKTIFVFLAAVFISATLKAQQIPEEPYRPLGWDPVFYGKPAPKFNMKSPDGSSFSSERLKGKFVVLDFWATWCTPCKLLTHELDSVLKKIPSEKLQVIGVNHREQMVKGGNAVGYWKKKGYFFPMAVDENYAKKVKAGFPTSIVIDPEGIVAGYFMGFTPTTAGEIATIIWNLSEKPVASLNSIAEQNNLGEPIKALFLHDKLVHEHPELKESLIAERLKAMLRTNPWMGLNIAKDWSKHSGQDKTVLMTIGKIIAEANVAEKDIRDFGIKATENSIK